MTSTSSGLTDTSPTLYSTSKTEGVLYKCLNQRQEKSSCHVRLVGSSSLCLTGVKLLNSVPQGVPGDTATTTSRNQRLSSSVRSVERISGSIKAAQVGGGSAQTNAGTRTKNTGKSLARDTKETCVTTGRAAYLGSQMVISMKKVTNILSRIETTYYNTASSWRSGYESSSRNLLRSLRSRVRNIFDLNWLFTTRTISGMTTELRICS